MLITILGNIISTVKITTCEYENFEMRVCISLALMHKQRWRICGKLNIQLSETWLLKLHKQT